MATMFEAARPSVRPALLARHPLVTYFALTYVISWAVELPLAASAQGWTTRSFPYSLHYLAAYGPLLAAFITTWATAGAPGVRDLLARLVRWRIRPIWWVVGFSPLLLYAIAAAALRLVRGAWTDVALLGRINYLPDLGFGALALWMLTFGIGEETGWRGFALPRLQRNRTALSASLILAAFWILWHLPTFLYLPTYVKLGVAILPGFALGIVAGAIVFTWLYNSTRGSILLVALGHAALNFVTGSPVGDQTIAAIISTAIIVWAVVVIFVWKPATLSSADKQVL